VIDGSCDPAFTAVRDVFAQSLSDGDDLGAAVAVYLDGRPVVDLWGVADKRSGRAWARDTACITFSCTKAVTATAALRLAERGAVRLAGPVTDWWPDFGAHGKDATTGEHLLSHQAGLPAFDRPVTVAEAADPVALADRLAGQAPEWAPGSAHGYHALTFGWLVGELVRRHAGRPVGDYVRAELGPQLWLGVPPELLGGLARISAGGPLRVADRPAPHELVVRFVRAATDPTSLMTRSAANPAGSMNDPVLLGAGWPAAGLVTTARSFAEFYARLVAGQILAPETLGDALRERVRGPDRTMVTETAFGLGFMLPCANMYLPPAARATAFGHPGASGALGLGDPQARLGFAYIPNLSRPMLSDRRAHRLVEAVYSAL
jgi:CubicO group peptidase (beta-lactamase class C family)